MCELVVPEVLAQASHGYTTSNSSNLLLKIFALIATKANTGLFVASRAVGPVGVISA